MSPRSLPFHYAWVVVAITALTLIASAGVRAAPGVLIKPLEAEFGWDRASISVAVAISLIVFGLGGPLSGTLVDRYGPRRVALTGLALVVGLGLLPLILGLSTLWQLYLFWGVGVGLGTGATGTVLGATIAVRWFRQHRGTVIGLFGGANSAGQLLLLPAMMVLTVTYDWRFALILPAVLMALLLLPVALLLRDKPEDVGLEQVGGPATTSAERAEDSRAMPMSQAVRSRDFWLLAGSFFVCGYTTNGLIGTHLIPHAVEHGFTEVTTAGAVGLMGMMNIVGTTASGWLSDRYDSRKLLAAYYGFRALSLAALPLILEVPYLYLFAVVYGLDWIATVPPTTNLTARIFGRASMGTVFGWIFFTHMLGGALAAYAGGFFRELLGDYHLMFLSAAAMGFIAVGLSLSISRPARTPARLQPVPAT